MKTRKLLFAMALPAVFAACTAEDLVETSSVKTLDGRAVLGSVPMDIVQGDAETKFAWSAAANYYWKFEAGDQYGAAITDPTLATNGDYLNSVEDVMLTNYIYTQQPDGKYSTTSQMVEGAYFLYSYPGFASKSTRDLIPFELGAQTADLDNPEAVMQENQLFISPIYHIRKTSKGENVTLPLAFRPYWSAAVIKIVNNTSAAFKLSQIVLIENYAIDNSFDFITKGEISPKKVAAALSYKISDDESGYVVEDTRTMKMANLEGSTDLSTNAVKSKMIALNCADYEVAKGAEVTAYMTVPAGTHNDLSAEIILNVNGISKKVLVQESSKVSSTSKSIPVTGLATVTFERKQAKSVFGLTTTGAVKPLNIAQANLQDADGFYVNTNADLLNVLNSQTGSITIYNIGNVKIDDSVASALRSYSGANVTFSNAIDIETTAAQTITKTTFKGGATLKAGTVTFSSDVKLDGASTLTITGGKAELSDGTYNNSGSKIVVNGGELVVNKTLPIKAIDVQKGTLTLQNANQTIGSTSGIEDLTFGTDNATALNVSLNSGTTTRTLTIAAGYNLVLAGKTVATINSAVNVAGTLTNNGAIVNNANIAAATTTSSIVNNGSIETAATVDGLTNNGYVKLTDGWYSKVDIISGNGLVDNTVGGVVEKGSSSCTVYRVLTGSNPAIKDVEDLMVLNNVTFTRNATIQNALFLGTTSIEGGTVKIKTGGSLTIGKTTDKAALIQRVLGLTDDELSNYKVSVRVYEGATLDALDATTYEVGDAVLLNRGTVILSSGWTDWTPTNATNSRP